jgi:hypothetical protein
MVSFVEHNLPFEARPRNMQGESETRVPYRRHPGRPRTLVNTAWLMLFRREGACDNFLESMTIPEPLLFYLHLPKSEPGDANL